jgi:2-oxoglutarate ferredoxin oxidoreductase subunit alpha
VPLTELNAILGGPQGSGIETSMMIIGRALARRGYGFLANREYFSNIVGRHSYIHLRVKSDEYPRSLTYPVDLLVAMDAETIFYAF